jgi:hypothetical protein
VDDIGLLPMAQDAAEGLYRLVDAAYEKRSVAASSNLHPATFDELTAKTDRDRDHRPAAPPCARLPDHRRQRPPHPSPGREGVQPLT